MKRSKITVAIQPDIGAPENCSYPRWRQTLERLGSTVIEVDVFRNDFISKAAQWNGFMWRHSHGSRETEVARRVFPVLEQVLGVDCYPDFPTRWHFDDKISQALLLEAKGLPIPETHVFFRKEDALRFFEKARWPLVLKLAGGAGSQNVRLLRNREDACTFANVLFGRGLVAFPPEHTIPRTRKELRDLVAKTVRSLGLYPQSRSQNWIPQKDYVLIQEFLPNNHFDTRITVIGNRAFGFRRRNRPGDFRSSGSGLIDHDPSKVDLETVKLAFDVARTLGTQSVAIDGLRRGEDRVVGEISYTYMSNAVEKCPGHWDEALNWHPGHMWPEEAQATDFFARLSSNSREHAS